MANTQRWTLDNALQKIYDEVTSRINVNATIVGSLANLQSIGIDITSPTVAAQLTTGLVTGATQLIIYPPVAGLIYYGSTQTNLATNGLPLNAGDPPAIFNFATPFPIYAVNDGTTRNVRVGESK